MSSQWTKKMPKSQGFAAAVTWALCSLLLKNKLQTNNIKHAVSRVLFPMSSSQKIYMWMNFS